MAAVWTKPDFLGNPYYTVTAIDTSGGIACDRTSGSTPFFFQVSAKNITATGVKDAWCDLEFRWVLRNSDGSAIVHNDGLTDPSTGQLVDPMTDQFGPEAAFVLRDAGTYTLTLYCRGKNGSGFTTASVSQTITVSAYSPSNTYYVDPVSGNNANPGTEASPKADLTGLIADDTAIYLKSGTTLQTSAEIILSYRARFRMDVYGGTAPATIQAQAGATGSRTISTHVSSQNASGTWGDWVVSNIIIDANNVHSYTIGGTHGTYEETGIYRNTYFDRCTFRNEATAGNHIIIQDATNDPDGSNGGIGSLGFWACDFERPTVEGRSRFYISIREPWRFYLGCTIEGHCENNILDHHCYDAGFGDHRLFRWVTFGANSGNGNFCINADASGAIGPQVDCFVVDGCLGRGTKFFVDASNSNNAANGTNTEWQRVMWQFNATDDSITQGDFFFYAVSGQAVCRYNVGWGSRTNSWFYPNSSPGDLDVYGNNWYAADGSSLAFFSASNGDQLFRSNTLYSTRLTSSNLYDLGWALDPEQERSFDNNTFFLSATPVINDRDGVETETWANWQSNGYDTSSTLTTDGTPPSWPDPANGVFSSSMSAIPDPPDLATSYLGLTAGGSYIVLQT